MSRALPSALVIGPMKSGTSWIQNYLEARGDICLPDGVKETFYFDRHFDRGKDWYASHFSGASARRATVEVGPSYFHCPQAPENVRDVLGTVPLIVTLRDPVKRAWSHYLHLSRYGYTRGSLQQAVLEFPEILEASRFNTCMDRWRVFFPDIELHVLWQETLAQAPDDYTRKLCASLGIPFLPVASDLPTRTNAAAAPPSQQLARFGSSAATFLRGKGLYGAVNFAKRAGLKDVFYGKPGGRALPVLSDADAAWLGDQLVDEMPKSAHFS